MPKRPEYFEAFYKHINLDNLAVLRLSIHSLPAKSEFEIIDFHHIRLNLQEAWAQRFYFL